MGWFHRVISVRLLGAVCVMWGAMSAEAQPWRPVPAGKFNISGLALVEQEGARTTFLVVQDNKKPDEDRAGLVTVEGDKAPEYKALAWPSGGELPRDLEAVSTVPGSPRTFLALDSNGRVYRLELKEDNSALSLKGSFELPAKVENPNFEGLAVQKLGKQLLVTWAHRGKDLEAGVLCWGTLDLSKEKEPVGEVETEKLTFSWPSVSEVRHISDLKVDGAGVVYTSAASDPGNFGPFQSGVYAAGTFGADEKGKISFRKNESPTRLQISPFNKIEALELVPGARGGLALGSDDETAGGSILLNW